MASGTSVLLMESVGDTHSRRSRAEAEVHDLLSAGILQMMLFAPRRILAPHWELVTQAIRWLVSIQHPSGNWPSKAGIGMFDGEEEDEKDQLVQSVQLLSVNRSSSTRSSSGGVMVPQVS